MGAALARLDWLTLRSPVEPREGARWRGSFVGTRFLAIDRPGLEVRCGASPGSMAAVYLTGKEFFRMGERWRPFVRDVWGWPPPPLSASRVDVALEWASGGREALVLESALSLQARLQRANPVRYGWALGLNDSRPSGGGLTVYVFPQNQSGTQTYSGARSSSPWLWRVYQEREAGGRWAPLRLELERKRFEERSADEAVFRAGREFEAATGERLDDEALVTGAVECPPVDGRQASAKLLRQAFGLVRLAELRRTHGVKVEGVRAKFAELWSMVLGPDVPFDGLTCAERREREKMEQSEVAGRERRRRMGRRDVDAALAFLERQGS